MKSRRRHKPFTPEPSSVSQEPPPSLLWKVWRYLFIALVALSALSAVAYAFKPVKNSQGDTKDEPNSPKNPCRALRVLYGDVQQANRVLIGEAHKLGQEELVQCIEGLTEARNQPKQVILLEGHPEGLEINCSEVSLKQLPNRKCMGWENHENIILSNEQYIKVYTINFMLKFAQKYQHLKREFFSPTFDANFDAMIREDYIPQAERTLKILHTNNIKSADKLFMGAQKKQYRETEIDLEQFHHILKQRELGKSYKEIFQPIAQYTRLLDIKDLPDFNDGTSLIKQRHDSLIRMLVENKDAFTIAITGRAHVDKSIFNRPGFKPKYPKELLAAIDYLYAELNKTKDSNPYAVLVS